MKHVGPIGLIVAMVLSGFTQSCGFNSRAIVDPVTSVGSNSYLIPFYAEDEDFVCAETHKAVFPRPCMKVSEFRILVSSLKALP